MICQHTQLDPACPHCLAIIQQRQALMEQRRQSRQVAVPRQEEPTLVQTGLTAVKEAAKIAWGGFRGVPPEIKQQRLALCQACPSYRQGRCKECHCIMSVKTAWADMACPLGKWGPVFLNSAPPATNT